jgi:hypothetical protein
MVVVLVHWLIDPKKTAEFEAWWEKMPVERGAGLIHETLTKIAPESKEDPRFHTFSIGDPFYATYLNIAYWESIEQFEQALAARIPKAQETVEDDGSRKLVVKMEPFEFKMRERVFLEIKSHRGDHPIQTSPADSQ